LIKICGSLLLTIYLITEELIIFAGYKISNRNNNPMIKGNDMTYIENLRAGKVDKIMSAVRGLSSKFLATMAGWELSATQAKEGTDLMAEVESLIDDRLKDLLCDRDARALKNLEERLWAAQETIEQMKLDLVYSRRETAEIQRRNNKLERTTSIGKYDAAVKNIKELKGRVEALEAQRAELRSKVLFWKEGKPMQALQKRNDELQKESDRLRTEVAQYQEALGQTLLKQPDYWMDPPRVYDPELEFLADRRSEAIYEMVTRLPDRQQALIRMRFYGDMSFEEIARELGVTRERARQMTAQAERKMRHPSMAKMVKEFYEQELPERDSAFPSPNPQVKIHREQLLFELRKRLRGRTTPLTYAQFCKATNMKPSEGVFYGCRQKVRRELGYDH
jgi:RNA polymerase sigma factor (sigma-70 family)